MNQRVQMLEEKGLLLIAVGKSNYVVIRDGKVVRKTRCFGAAEASNWKGKVTLTFQLLLLGVLLTGCGGGYYAPAPAYYPSSGGSDDAIIIHGDLTQPNDFIFGF